MNIAVTIKLHREAKGLSQRELGEALSLTQGAVSQYELGIISPTVHALERIANVLGISVEELLKTATQLESIPQSDVERALREGIQYPKGASLEKKNSK